MTKLDEAVEAACIAWVEVVTGKPVSRREAMVEAIPMKTAIQAAVKVLVPEDQLYDDIVADGIFPAPTLLAIGWNNCRAETLKNAGVE